MDSCEAVGFNDQKAYCSEETFLGEVLELGEHLHGPILNFNDTIDFVNSDLLLLKLDPLHCAWCVSGR